MENLKIEIRPIPNRGNRNKYCSDLEYLSQPHTVGPGVNHKTLKFETGLNQKDLDYLKSIDCPYDLTDTFKNGIAHPFWESTLVKISLLATPMFLYPYNNILDFIKWKYLLRSDFVYVSEEEMKNGTKPMATHYLYNEDVENEIKATALEQKISINTKFSNLSLKRKRDIIFIVTEEDTTNKNENYLTIKLEELLSTRDSLKKVESYLKQDVETVNLISEVKLAIQKNILKRTKKGIFYFENNLGFSEEDVLDFLQKPENQEIYLNIKSKL